VSMLLKRIFLRIIRVILKRYQIIRLSRALMNMALGDNNGNMETNGEFFLLRQVLSLEKDAVKGKIIIFDVGANVGEWTAQLLHIAEEQGSGKVSVHCFEPSPFTFAQLQSTLQKIGDEMGNMKENRELHVTHDGAGTNSLYKRRLEGLDISYDRSETIQITTVDTYCSENDISHINFLKIDVEGHELAVVQGARSMLKRKAIDYIQFEYGGCWIDSRTLFMDMYDLLTSFGYIVGKIMPNRIAFYDKYDQRMETFQMANFFACKPENVGQFKRINMWTI
jgi:FkbM family methyltransferase